MLLKTFNAMIHLTSFISKGDLKPTLVQELMLFTKIRVKLFVASRLHGNPNFPHPFLGGAFLKTTFNCTANSGFGDTQKIFIV